MSVVVSKIFNKKIFYSILLTSFKN